jgi:hypothetical protein
LGRRDGPQPIHVHSHSSRPVLHMR